jgi:hypothetical protein
LNHLSSCPDCSRLAEAQKILSSALETAKVSDDGEATPISVLKAKLAMSSTTKELSIMATLKNGFLGHRGLGFGIALGVLAILFIVLVPLPYSRTVGYNLTFSGVDQGTPTQAIMGALDKLGYGNLSVNVNASPAGMDYLFSNLPNLRAAKEVAAAFASLSGTKAKPQIKPIIETVSGSLYAQARNKSIQIEVNGEDKTDEQIQAEIESKLAAEGFKGSLVYLKTDSSGKRNVHLEIQEADSGQGGGEAKQTIVIDGRGKNDSQIQNEIKQKLIETGKPNANVSVKVEGPDSLRKIEIQVIDTTGR